LKKDAADDKTKDGKERQLDDTWRGIGKKMKRNNKQDVDPCSDKESNHSALPPEKPKRILLVKHE